MDVLSAAVTRDDILTTVEAVSLGVVICYAACKKSLPANWVDTFVQIQLAIRAGSAIWLDMEEFKHWLLAFTASAVEIQVGVS